jgi:hypothetical protein
MGERIAHQVDAGTFGGKADHLTQKICVGTLFQKRAQAYHLWVLGGVGVSQPDPTGESSVAAECRALATAL